MKVDAGLLTGEFTAAGEDAKRFEERGFDGVMSFEGPHDPFLPLVLAASRTERVELMTAIAVAFARNPMVCAYVANDLQLLSRGRFILGLGTQVRAHVERRFSQPWSRPNARMREFVRALRAVWKCWETGEKLDFQGEFYRHTLMPPLFSPGKNPFGTPRVFLAGFGPGMVRIAGEVGDGWIVHPLHSRSFVDSVLLPSLRDGMEKTGRGREDFEIACQTIVMLGSNDEELERARGKAKAQIAFYASTPSYRVMLDHHGWGDLQPELNRLARKGSWLEMIGHVTDDMLDTVGISGTPSAVARKLLQRESFADRVALVLYNETDPDAVTDLVRGLHGEPD